MNKTATKRLNKTHQVLAKIGQQRPPMDNGWGTLAQFHHTLTCRSRVSNKFGRVFPRGVSQTVFSSLQAVPSRLYAHFWRVISLFHQQTAISSWMASTKLSYRERWIRKEVKPHERTFKDEEDNKKKNKVMTVFERIFFPNMTSWRLRKER